MNAQVDRKDAWRSRPTAIQVGEADRSAALTENPLPSRDESAHPERIDRLRLARRGIGSWSRSPIAQQARPAGARKGYPRSVWQDPMVKIVLCCAASPVAIDVGRQARRWANFKVSVLHSRAIMPSAIRKVPVVSNSSGSIVHLRSGCHIPVVARLISSPRQPVR